MPRGFRKRAIFAHYGDNIADLGTRYSEGWEPQIIIHGDPKFLSPSGKLWPVLGESVPLFTSSSGTFIRDGLIHASSSAECRIGEHGIVMEPAATNLLLHSEDLTASEWTDVQTPNVNANGHTAPSAPDFSDEFSFTSDADTIQDDNGSNFEGVQQTVTVTDDSGGWTAAVAIKEVTSDVDPSIRLQHTGGTTELDYEVKWNQSLDVAEDIGTDTADDFGLITVNSEWRILWVRGDGNNSGNTNRVVTLYPVKTAGTATGVTAFWGAQLTETEGFVHYIPTDTSTIARVNDQFTMDYTETFTGHGLSLYLRGTSRNSDFIAQSLIQVKDLSPDNRFVMNIIGAGGTVAVTVEDAGASDTSDMVDPNFSDTPSVEHTVEIMANCDTIGYRLESSVDEGDHTDAKDTGLTQLLDGDETFTTFMFDGGCGIEVDTLALVKGRHFLTDMRTLAQ